MPGGTFINPAAALPLGERLASSANFHEDIFVKPIWQYTFVRTPGLFLSNYQIEKVRRQYKTPDVSEIHDFINNLFMKGQVSWLHELLSGDILIHVVTTNASTWPPFLLFPHWCAARLCMFS